MWLIIRSGPDAGTAVEVAGQRYGALGGVGLDDLAAVAEGLAVVGALVHVVAVEKDVRMAV